MLVASTYWDHGFRIPRKDAIWPPNIVIITRTVTKRATATTITVNVSDNPFIVIIMSERPYKNIPYSRHNVKALEKKSKNAIRL